MKKVATEANLKNEQPQTNLPRVGVWLLLVMASGACAPAPDEPVEPDTAAQRLALDPEIVCAEVAAPVPLLISVASILPKSLANSSATLKLNITNLNPHAGTVKVFAARASEVGIGSSTAGSTNVPGSSSKFLNVSASALGLVTAQLNFPASLQLSAAIDYPQNSPSSDARSVPVQLFYHPNGAGWLVYDEAIRASTYSALTPEAQAQRDAAVAAGPQFGFNVSPTEVGKAFVQKVSSSVNYQPPAEAPQGH